MDLRARIAYLQGLIDAQEATTLVPYELSRIPCPAVYVGANCARCGGEFTADDAVNLASRYVQHTSCPLNY